MLIVSTALKEKEKAAIYKFRYKVGIQKYGLKQRYANHSEEIVKEPLDDQSYIFSCINNDTLVGTTRTSYAVDNTIEFYADLYDIHNELSKCPSKVVVGSKLLVDQFDVRSTISYTYKLLSFQYVHAINNGARYAYIDCGHNTKLNQFYTKLGFKLHKQNALHPDTGIINVFMLDMHNIDHLNNIKSPFRKIYNGYKNECLHMDGK